MRLSNRVDTSKPRDWEITMKSFQQYRIDYLERLVRGHICLWPEGSQEVKLDAIAAYERLVIAKPQLSVLHQGQGMNPSGASPGVQILH